MKYDKQPDKWYAIVEVNPEKTTFVFRNSGYLNRMLLIWKHSLIFRLSW